MKYAWVKRLPFTQCVFEVTHPLHFVFIFQKHVELILKSKSLGCKAQSNTNTSQVPCSQQQSALL